MSLDKNELKEAVKEGIEAWLDKQFQTFGKWSLYTLGSMVLAAVVYFVLNSMGWHK